MNFQGRSNVACNIHRLNVVVVKLNKYFSSVRVFDSNSKYYEACRIIARFTFPYLNNVW